MYWWELEQETRRLQEQHSNYYELFDVHLDKVKQQLSDDSERRQKQVYSPYPQYRADVEAEKAATIKQGYDDMLKNLVEPARREELLGNVRANSEMTKMDDPTKAAIQKHRSDKRQKQVEQNFRNNHSKGPDNGFKAWDEKKDRETLRLFRDQKREQLSKSKEAQKGQNNPEKNQGTKQKEEMAITQQAQNSSKADASKPNQTALEKLEQQRSQRETRARQAQSREQGQTKGTVKGEQTNSSEPVTVMKSSTTAPEKMDHQRSQRNEQNTQQTNNPGKEDGKDGR